MGPAFRDDGLLRPGITRTAGLTGDDAFVRAMCDVESAWLDVLGAPAHLDPPDPAVLAADGEAAGNPVVPLLRALRPGAPELLHRGLTSQDVLDSALMLMTARVRAQVLRDARQVIGALTRLAQEHRDSVMSGRTLTQSAVPITFGLKVAQWLAAVLDAVESIERLVLPVQCGGAAGTLAAVAEFTDPLEARRGLAQRLGLADVDLPWHTRRGPVTAAADALATLLGALGTMAGDIAQLARPEIGELAESGGGVSSTMPHKQNPIRSVLIRSAALQGPPLTAGIHTAAGLMVDERPDGAWHAEWPLYRDLLTVTLIATSQAVDLVEGLVVDTDVMQRRAQAQVAHLLAEKYGAGAVPEGADPRTYLGASGAMVDAVLARAAASAGPRVTLTRLAGSAQDRDVLVVGAGLGTAAATLWSEVVPLLVGVEVLGVDLPGHGTGPATSRGFTVADLAAAIRREVARTVSPGRRVWYAGVSLAGAVALELALDPGPFQGVVSLASASRLGQPQAWRERADLVRRAGTSVMIAGSVERWFAPGFTERAPELVGRMLHDLEDVDDGSYALCCEALAAYDLSGQLPAAQVPVLMAPGELDVVVTVDAARMDSDAAPQGRIQPVPAVGHQPPVEAPGDVAAMLRDFMGGQR